jgi:hypothetical protein
MSHLLTHCQQAVPEFCVQTAIQIVARFVFDFTDESSIHRAYTCLSFLLNSLLGSKNGKFGSLATDFYVQLFSLMRSCKNAVNPEDEELNKASLTGYVLQFTYYYIFISHVHIFIVIFLSE